MKFGLRVADLTSHITEFRRLTMSKRLIVVGGGAGGPSAAAKAKRVDPELEVTILEGGEHVSFSA